MFWMLSYLSPSFLQSLLQPKSLALSQSMPALEQGIVFVTMVIVAPITEEFLFRGIILNRWIKKWGLVQGLITSSLLFGFLHINPIGLSMFGLIMGLLYLQTKELWTPILCHALNNLIVFSFMFFSRSNNRQTSIENFQSMGWVGVIIALIALSFLVPFLKESFHKVRIKLHPPAI
ncbi:MAG: CPBP family intramembrane metalloprotease [Cyanobacteria bacterium]|nr:CPBP family intramembrane metalloprotease [Cyanobacteriota bacterium]